MNETNGWQWNWFKASLRLRRMQAFYAYSTAAAAFSASVGAWFALPMYALGVGIVVYSCGRVRPHDDDDGGPQHPVPGWDPA